MMDGSATTSPRCGRDSNLELMRIVLMLAIVAHHSVVNSGVMELWDLPGISLGGGFLTLWGMWGKAAINAFVMVTGWFMCASRLTARKVFRLVAQIYFWKVVLDVAFVATGRMGAADVAKSLVSPLRAVDGSFTASFLFLYLLIPFLNTLVRGLDERSHRRLLGLLLLVYVGATTFLGSSTAFSEVGWYVTLYLLAAYLRLHPTPWSEDPVMVRGLFAASVALSVASVIGVMVAGAWLGVGGSSTPYYFVSDSGKVLAFLPGVTCFLFFKSLRVPRSRAVNAVASTTFGVLLVHANSDAMREWLWGDVLSVPGAYLSLPLPALVGYMALCALGVFAVCSALDYARLKLVEPLYMGWFDRRFPGAGGQAEGRTSGAVPRSRDRTDSKPYQ